MQIQWNIQLGHLYPERVALRFVEILDHVRASQVGEAIDEDPTATKFLNTPLSFHGRRMWILHCYAGPGEETVRLRTRPVELVHLIIDLFRNFDRFGSAEDPFNTGHSQRDSRDRYAARLHVVDSFLDAG